MYSELLRASSIRHALLGAPSPMSVIPHGARARLEPGMHVSAIGATIVRPFGDILRRMGRYEAEHGRPRHAGTVAAVDRDGLTH